MEFGESRKAALTHLESRRSAQLYLLQQLFEAIDRCIDAYEVNSKSDVYARVCGLTLLKAKHLALGSYSLILDGLGQEAGALMRPFIEYTELLTYFRLFPEAAVKAFEGGLPKAGERAKAIDGIYKEFREHLNAHASHSSYSRYSLSHLLEPNDFRFKKMQRMVPHVLETNLRDFTIQVYLLLHEAVLAVERVDQLVFRLLAETTDNARLRVLADWELNAR